MDAFDESLLTDSDGEDDKNVGWMGRMHGNSKRSPPACPAMYPRASCMPGYDARPIISPQTLAPASKEQLVFLIQGHESLLELANLEDEVKERHSRFPWL